MRRALAAAPPPASSPRAGSSGSRDRGGAPSPDRARAPRLPFGRPRGCAGTSASCRLSGRAQDPLDHAHVLPPARRLFTERPPPCGCQLVVLGRPVLIGRGPLAVDPPLLLEPLQG